MKSQVFLLIGGNLGDRLNNLATARDRIGIAAGKVLKSSSTYETAAWGNTDQPNFLNQVLRVETKLLPIEFLDILLDIELGMGRKRQTKFGPRSIDLDILFFNDDVVQTDKLTIPHPEIQNRKFALVPLYELAPGFRHPVLNKTIEQLLQECMDELEVKKFIC